MSGAGFAKLDGGIVDSTLWMQPHDVLRVWIAMLAKCDSYGIVRASVPAFAHLCMVPIERLEQILKILTSPDSYSRTPDDDGRRLRAIEGGWLITNYVKYRELVQTKPQSHADRQRKYRERIKERDEKLTRDAGVTNNVTRDAEAEAEEKRKDTQPTVESPQAALADACPHVEIVALYHELLPSLTRVKEWTPVRQTFLRKRWNESRERQSLDWWRGFFCYVAESDFLTGKTSGRDGRPFECDLEWLVRPKNFIKVIEGRYENRGVAA